MEDRFGQGQLRHPSTSSWKVYTNTHASVYILGVSYRTFLLTILLLTGLAYATVLQGEFVYEDRRSLEGWHVASTQGLSLPSIDHLLTLRGLSRLSYHIDLGGSTVQPWRFHLTNVLLHLGNGWLVSLLLRRLQVPLGWTLVGTCIFLWHPLQTESVAYIMSRTDLLSTGLVLCGSLLILRPGLLAVLGAIAACVLAVGAKESAVVGFGLLILLRQFQGPISGVVWACLCGGLGFAAVVGYTVIQDYVSGMVTSYTWLEYLSFQATAFWTYVGMLFLPIGQTVDHDFEGVSLGIRFVCLVGLSVLLIGVVGLWTNRSVLFSWLGIMTIGLLWALIAISPRFVIPLSEIMTEHHQYLPMVGYTIALTSGLAALVASLERRSFVRTETGVRI